MYVRKVEKGIPKKESQRRSKNDERTDSNPQFQTEPRFENRATEELGIMSVFEELRGLLRLRGLQLLALCCWLTALAALSIAYKLPVRDPDIWWHLKTGDWIVAHHVVPSVGIFSRTAGTHAWVAYSWLYEVLLSCAYAWFGLVGFALFGVLVTLFVAVILFWMLHRLCGQFWIAWLLAVIASYSFLFSLLPRPVFGSMAFFAVEITFLLEAQRTGSIRRLWWLPLLFVLWANIHIQFVYGLLVVGLFFGVNLVERVASWRGFEPDFIQPPKLPLSGLMGMVLACFAATFVGPYTYRLYYVLADLSQSHVPYSMILEMQAFRFNSLRDYLVLLLTMAAFFALGWRSKLDLFKLSLLIIASFIAFRTVRDAWFLCICATAFVADFRPPEDLPTPMLKVPELAAVATVLVISMLLFARNTGFDTRNLDRTISREFPVNAVNFVRRNLPAGPLYNNLDWGGFLVWYLPQYPVAIDGRTNIYGDEMVQLMYNSSRGDESYTSDPYLNHAGLVLLPKKTPLAALLTVDPRFRLVYDDELAVVFVRN